MKTVHFKVSRRLGLGGFEPSNKLMLKQLRSLLKPSGYEVSAEIRSTIQADSRQKFRAEVMPSIRARRDYL